MLDRFGFELKLGQFVRVYDHPELSLSTNWFVAGFIDHDVAIEVILQNFVSNEIVFVNLLDVQKEF